MNYTTNNTTETIISLIIEGYKHVQSKNFLQIQNHIKYEIENGTFKIINGELIRTDHFPTTEEQLKYINNEILILENKLNEYKYIQEKCINGVKLSELILESINYIQKDLDLFNEYKDIVTYPEKYINNIKSFINYE